MDAIQPKVHAPTAAHYRIKKMMTLFYPEEKIKAPYKLRVSRNNGTIDEMELYSIQQAEQIADQPPGFKAATLWAEVEGRGFGLVGINK